MVIRTLKHIRKHKREYLSMSFINLSDDMNMKMTVFSNFHDAALLLAPVVMSL